MEFRNEKLNHFGGVDMEINHPERGWIPFSASPDDVEPLGAEMYALALPTAAPADPLPPAPIPQVISDRQFFQQLAIDGRITQEEALNAVGPGIIPTSMDALINQMPSDLQFAARMLVRGATTFQRQHPVTELIGQLYGLNSDQIDTLWRNASSL